MKYAFVAVLAVVVATATVSAAVLPATPAPRTSTLNPGVWTPLGFSTADFPASASIDTVGVLVIKTQAEYDAFLQSVTYARTPNGPDFPYVDFSHQFLVVASVGMKDLGFDVSVTGAKTNGDRVVVSVNHQLDNPQHCRITHKVEFVGQIALINKPAVADFTLTEVGIVDKTTVLPYNNYYNCGCPEM